MPELYFTRTMFFAGNLPVGLRLGCASALIEFMT